MGWHVVCLLGFILYVLGLCYSFVLFLVGEFAIWLCLILFNRLFISCGFVGVTLGLLVVYWFVGFLFIDNHGRLFDLSCCVLGC